MAKPKQERGVALRTATSVLHIRVVGATDAFELFAHGAGRLGASADFGCDAPDNRNKGGCAQGDQGYTGITTGIMPDIVGDKKACAETDCDLRKTNDSRDRKVFAKFVQGKL